MAIKICKNPALNKVIKYTVDLGVTVEDELLNPVEIVDYLRSSMKIDNLKGNLGSDITISLAGNKNVVIATRLRIAKRYIKYLLKKVLNKMGILEYLKINATEKNAYKVKYLKAETKATA